MAPKLDARGRPIDPRAKGQAPPGPQISFLDRAFPLWQEPGKEEKEVPVTPGGEKYEDVAGLVLPPESQMFCDTWKRPEELVLNFPDVPMVLTVAPPPPPPDPSAAAAAAAAAGDKDPAKRPAGAVVGSSKNAPVAMTRDLEGTLSAGHRTFEWLHAVFVMVMSAQKTIKQGEYLWELIYPKDKDGQATKSPNGKYKVKLFIMDAWRTVVVDDRIPVDLFGRPLLVNARPIQLWPLLLAKALLKVLAAHRILHCALPHTTAAFQLLTGWPQEDLLDPLSGTRLSGGRVFDRLEDAVRGNEERSERHAVAAVTLLRRALPERPPPRLIVLVGPSGVGRGALLRRLLGELPDKFGMTVSHTTRPPREHEAPGVDYFFTEVASFREEAAGGRFLEYAPVPSTRGTHYYGTSFATVREVAATGKLCLMGLDVQGVRSLRANKRIDGLYVFLAPPSLEELERRQRGRLKEAESTIAKRLAWAAAEVERARGVVGMIDCSVENGDDGAKVYLAVKEAISTLSPIIRNRLHGLPAYVLDYADLIAPNLVEKPFLKPVVITGPNTGERRAIMDQLVHEFPDVFAHPRRSTTRPHNEDALHRVDAADQPPEQPAWEVIKTRDGEEVQRSLPTYVSVTPAEFTAAAQSGAFLQWHTELFKHPLVARQWGVTAEAIKEVIRAGRLPLIECETDGAEMLKKRGIDCLTIFLKPPSQEVFESRLRQHLTETDDEIAARLDMARREIDAASAPGAPFDAVIVNDDPEAAYDQLTRLISRCRPDIIVPEEDRQAEPPPPPKQPVLVLCGPAAGGRAALAKQLLSTFPDKFASPGFVTDRKPARGEISTPALAFVAAKELARMAAEGAIAYQRAGEDKGSGFTAVTNAALLKVAGENKVAVLELPDYATALPGLRGGPVLKDALYVFVASPGQLTAALEAQQALARSKSAKGGGQGSRGAPAVDVEGALADLEQQAQVAAGSHDLYDAVVRADDMMDLISSVRAQLASHVPHVVPPPYRPLVVAGAFGTGKRRLLSRLFDALPGRFAVPVITTTRRPGPADPDRDVAREGMVVVAREEADAIAAADGFVTRREVLGEVYGVTVAAVKKVGASGRVPILEVDHVEDAAALRRRGFDATFLFIGMEDAGRLLTVIHEELSSNPPLGYELQDAVNQFFASAKAEMAASREDGLFDEWVAHAPDAPDPSFIRLAEAVHRHYPDVVTRHFVWGYGRQLWDPQVRTHGLRPLRVMVLGSAASGKSTQCSLLAQHFGMPHLNVGELIYAEVQQRTPLGLEAKEYMDTSKTLPDRFFFDLLTKRLAEPDCVARGWLLDGFPHTAQQCADLQALGIVPDKVLFLEGEHAVLLDRTRYRRYDPLTGKVYHMPDEGAEALSPPIRPERADGTVDPDVVARLTPRHDDSEENVRARLALADEHYGALRDAYEDISLRVNSAADPRVIFQLALDFLTLEARIPELQIVPSTALKELQYLVVTTLRYRRLQLLHLQQDDGRSYWVDAKELLGGNAQCALLCQDPSIFPTSHQLRRVDTSKLPRVALLHVDAPEPVRLLVSLFTGPQYPLLEDPPTPRNVLVLAGPAAAGKSCVLHMLLAAQAAQLELVPVLTSRPPLRREPAAQVMLNPPAADGTGYEVAEGRAGLGPSGGGGGGGATACCVPAEAFAAAVAAGQLMAVCAGWDGHRYGVSRAALQAAWAAGKLPVVEGPLELALALKELSTQMLPAPAPVPPTPVPHTPHTPAAAAPPTPTANPSSETVGLGPEPSRLRGTGDGAASTVGGAATAQAQAPSPGPVLTARVVYLSVDVAELDVRLRLQDQREEAAIGDCLAAARREAETLARLLAEAEAAARPRAPSSRTATPPAAPPQGGRLGMVTPPPPALTALSPPPSLPTPPSLDLVITASDAVVSFHAAKQLAADSWRRPRAQVAGQLVLESFDWRAPGGRPGRTVQRLRTFMANAALLELPRGRHLLRINSDPLFLHAVTFMSASPCTVGEYSSVLPGCDPAAHVAPLEGHYPDVPQGCVGLLFRYNLTLPEPATLAAYLSVSGEDMRAAARLLLVSRATGEAKLLASNRLHATELPAAGAGAPAGGYSLIALYDTSARPVVEEGSYCLTVTSSAPLGGAGVAEVPSHRVDEFTEPYRPNGRHVLSRHVITTTNSTQLCVLAASQPRLPFTMTLQEAHPGREVTWQSSADYPVLVTTHTNDGGGGGGAASGPAVAPEGYALIADVAVKPGKYLVTCTLDAAACPAGMQPHPQTGAMPGGAPVRLKMWVHPSAEERVCTVISDNSHAKYVQGVHDKWNAAPVQLIAQPAPGSPAVKGRTGGANAAAAAAAAKAFVGTRSSLAASMLEKYKAEQQQQHQQQQQQPHQQQPTQQQQPHQPQSQHNSQSGEEATAAAAAAGASGATASGHGDGDGEEAPPQVSGLSRVLKDGSVMALDPAPQLRVLRSQPPALLTASQLAERQARAAEAAAAEGAARLAGVGKALEASRGERAGFQAWQASSFAEWRASLVAAQQKAAQQRAEVAQSVKAAALMAAAGGAEVATPPGKGVAAAAAGQAALA